MCTAREEGGLHTAKQLGHWMHALADCRFCLRYEPARALEPISPVAAFDDKGTRARIAVQMHLFYPELADELIACTNRIPYRFDCYLSTDTPEKAAQMERAFREGSRAEKVTVACYENRGRDMAPFIAQMSPCLGQYDYLCHLHGKASAHSSRGASWRTWLLTRLLASPGHIAALLNWMETEPGIGLLFPRTFRGMKRFLGWRGNRRQAQALLGRMGLRGRLPGSPRFPAGNMFWARTDAIAPVFACGLSAADFPEESGQTEGTTAHCLERCWGCVARARGYRWVRMSLRKNA